MQPNGLGFSLDFLPNTITSIANPIVTAYATHQDSKIRKKEISARQAEVGSLLNQRAEEVKLANELEKLRVEKEAEIRPAEVLISRQNTAIMVAGAALVSAVVFTLYVYSD